ncbi:MAG: DUF2461 domain-containing protein [Muribaculum sp.]|nr:DUF2461 domain-containing protein [Muribaculum sp.]
MSYIPDLYKFFAELSANNNRVWFAANRERYDYLRACWMADLDRMIDHMKTWEPALDDQNAKSCAYRINRNLRFSQDKRPYKDHFGASIHVGGRRKGNAGYYIDIGCPDKYESGLYGGLWHVESPMLRKLRHAIVDNIEEFEEIVNSSDMLRDFPGWCSETIKTIPKGWDRSHPQAEYLRMTNYGKMRICTPEFYLDPDWPIHASNLFRTLKPFIDFINYSMEEEL